MNTSDCKDRVNSSSGSDAYNDESKRKARKVGEKLRRERLNSHLNQLSEQIPWIAESERRLDKVSILRLTVSYMKLHHGLKKKKISHEWKNCSEDKIFMEKYLQEADNGFLIVVSKTGSVIFVSPAINKCLGHSQVDVIGNSIYNLIHTDDHKLFDLQFECREGQEFHASPNNGCDHHLAPLNSAWNEHRSFYVHMQNLQCGEDGTKYDLVHILGHVKFDGSDMTSRHRKSSALNDSWLFGVCKPINEKPIWEISQFYVNQNEFRSQHAMDGKVLFTDHRISTLTGFFTSDSQGKSVYSLLNPEDMDAVAVSHMKIMTDGETPSTIFRLKTVSKNNYIYMESRSAIIKDPVTKDPKFIVSVNVCLDKNEGKKLLEEQAKRVKALISATKGLSLQDTDKSESCTNIPPPASCANQSPISTCDDSGISSPSQSSVQYSDDNEDVMDTVNSFHNNSNVHVDMHISELSYIEELNTENRNKKRPLKDIEIECQIETCEMEISLVSGKCIPDSTVSFPTDGKSSLLKSLLLTNDSCVDALHQNQNGHPENDVLSNSDQCLYPLRSSSLFSSSTDDKCCTSAASEYSFQKQCIRNSDPLSPDTLLGTLTPSENNQLRSHPNTLENHMPASCTQRTSSIYKTSTCQNPSVNPHISSSKLVSPSSDKRGLVGGAEPKRQFNLLNILHSHINDSFLCDSSVQETCENKLTLDKTSTAEKFNSISMSKNIEQCNHDSNMANMNFSPPGYEKCKGRSGNQGITSSADIGKSPLADLPNIEPNLNFPNGSPHPITYLPNGTEQCSEIDSTGSATEQCSKIDSTESCMTSMKSTKEAQQTNDVKMKTLLAQQLHMKHRHIDSNLRNQEEQVEHFKIQMDKLKEVESNSNVSPFVHRIEDLQSEIHNQKRILKSLKNEAYPCTMDLINGSCSATSSSKS